MTYQITYRRPYRDILSVFSSYKDFPDNATAMVAGAEMLHDKRVTDVIVMKVLPCDGPVESGKHVEIGRCWQTDVDSSHWQYPHDKAPSQ